MVLNARQAGARIARYVAEQMYDVLHRIKVIADDHILHRLLDRTDLADLPRQDGHKSSPSEVILLALNDDFSGAVQSKQKPRFLVNERHCRF